MNTPNRFDVLKKRVICFSENECSGDIGDTTRCACWWYGHFQTMDFLERWAKIALAFAIGFLIAHIIFH